MKETAPSRSAISKSSASMIWSLNCGELVVSQFIFRASSSTDEALDTAAAMQ
jgi:hypothetical protein